MGQYRKKPVIVEAYQTDTAITIHTLEGDLKGEKGDWIITGLRGEQYPCKPDIFEETYEAVEAVAQEKSLGEQIALDAAMCLGYILRGTTALFLLLLSLRFWADVLHTGLPAVILAAVLLAVVAACIRHILHKDGPARKAH